MSKSNLIETYMEDVLTEAEKLEFEQQLANNPELRAELQLQTDIIEAIKTTRRQDLKQKLNRVGVPPSGMAYISPRLIIGVGLALLIGIGGFLYLSDTSSVVGQQFEPRASSTFTPTLKEGNNIDNNKHDDENTVLRSPSEKQSASVEVEERRQEDTYSKTDNKTGYTTAKKVKPVAENIQKKTVEGDENTNTITKEKVSTPTVERQVSVPTVNQPSVTIPIARNRKENLGVRLPGMGFVDQRIEKVSKIEISTDNSQRKYSFHYKLTDNKLRLYGDFDKSIYEILEFNTASEKQLYLYYAGHYYPIEKQKEGIKPLKRIKDKYTIDSLSIIKDNRR